MSKIVLLVTCGLLVTAGVAAASDEAQEKPSWADKVKIKGDLRLRYEGFDQEGKFHDGRRDRFRMRARVDLTAKVKDSIRIGLQLRSGDPADPVSANQSLDGSFSGKPLHLAQAYADLTLTDQLSLLAGKFAPGKHWVVSDLQWDGDVTVEGAMQKITLGGERSKVMASIYQFVTEESSSKSDGYLFGGQVRPVFKMGAANTLTLGAGFDHFREPQRVADLTLDGALAGNKLTNRVDESGRLLSDFRIVNGFLIWKNTSVERWPLKIALFGYRNTGAADDNDTGFFGRLEVGSYGQPGQVQLRYTRYHSEPDALFYAFAQSDTSHGTNVGANRVDARVGLAAGSHVNLTWYNARPNTGGQTLNRWQVDYSLKF